MRMGPTERLLVFASIVAMCCALGSAIFMIGYDAFQSDDITTSQMSFLLVLTNLLTLLLSKIDKFLPKDDGGE